MMFFWQNPYMANQRGQVYLEGLVIDRKQRFEVRFPGTVPKYFDTYRSASTYARALARREHTHVVDLWHDREIYP